MSQIMPLVAAAIVVVNAIRGSEADISGNVSLIINPIVTVLALLGFIFQQKVFDVRLSLAVLGFALWQLIQDRNSGVTGTPQALDWAVLGLAIGWAFLSFYTQNKTGLLVFV